MESVMQALPGEAAGCTVNINQMPSSVLHAIFGFLGPRGLAIASCTCVAWRRLNKDKASNQQWRRFYRSRWLVTDPAGSSNEETCWQSRFGSKMSQGKSWAGRYEHDCLYGHKASIKALRLLPSSGVMMTGSMDRTVRLWDLSCGMPLCTSRPHGGTVRALCLDHDLAASGCSDNVVRLWHRSSAEASSADDVYEAEDMDAPADAVDGGAGGQYDASVGGGTVRSAAAASSCCFNLEATPQQLRGHIGPVTCLSLTEGALFSGSWDYSVRVWRRGTWDCVSVLKYPDWVGSVVARGGLLLVAAGPEVHVHDLPTGKLVRKFQNLHEGSVACLEGTHSGRTMFTGGADGLLLAHDLRMRDASRVLWHHNGSVHGLALESPWLASAAADGTVVMHNTEAATPTAALGVAGAAPQQQRTAGGVGGGGARPVAVPARRSLGTPGHRGPVYCVDLADAWLAAGSETVQLWDFTRAGEAEARAAAARAARAASKRAARARREQRAAAVLAAAKSAAAEVVEAQSTAAAAAATATAATVDSTRLLVQSCSSAQGYGALGASVELPAGQQVLLHHEQLSPQLRQHFGRSSSSSSCTGHSKGVSADVTLQDGRNTHAPLQPPHPGAQRSSSRSSSGNTLTHAAPIPIPASSPTSCFRGSSSGSSSSRHSNRHSVLPQHVVNAAAAPRPPTTTTGCNTGPPRRVAAGYNPGCIKGRSAGAPAHEGGVGCWRAPFSCSYPAAGQPPGPWLQSSTPRFDARPRVPYGPDLTPPYRAGERPQGGDGSAQGRRPQAAHSPLCTTGTGGGAGSISN